MKREFNAESPEKCLRPAQSAGERARVFGPIRDRVSADDSGIEKVRCRAYPPWLFCHYSAHAGGYRIHFKDVFDRPASIGVVGPPECTRRPERSFAGGSPLCEIGHSRQADELHAIARTQPVRHGIE